MLTALKFSPIIGPEIQILACHISAHPLRYLPSPPGMLLPAPVPHPQGKPWKQFCKWHTVSLSILIGWKVDTLPELGQSDPPSLKFPNWECE